MTELRTLHHLLGPRFRRRFLLLAGLVLLSGLAQVVGVGSVVPFMTVVADPSRLPSAPWLADLPRPTLAALLGLAMVLALAAGNLVSAASAAYGIRVSGLLADDLATRLFRGYLHRPYPWLLERHSVHLGRNVLVAVPNVVGGFVMPFTQALLHGVSAALLLGVLLVADPRVAAATGLVLGGAYLLIYRVFRTRLEAYARRRVQVERDQSRIVYESLAGLKNVRLLRSEPFLLERFGALSSTASDLLARSKTMTTLPRYVLETVAFAGVVALVLHLSATRGSLAEAMPVLGLYVVGGVRLLPALQNTFLAVADMRRHAALLRDLVADLDFEPPSPGPVDRLPFRDRLILSGLRFRHPGRPEPVLDGVDLALEKGASVALVGATGAGKTTLADLVLGFLEPDGGEIRVDGALLTRENRSAWQANLGYVPQEVYLVDDTLRTNIALGVPEVDEARLEEVARAAGLHDLVARRLPDGYDTVIGERGVKLSGGERQRVGIARALYRDPDLLVLDEPTSALDPATEAAVMEALHGLEGRTLLIIAHRASTVAGVDRVYRLEGGRLEEVPR